MSAASSPSTLPENAIAIIGMAGKFPGAPNIDQFWQNLSQKKESIHQFSDEALRQIGIPDATLSQSNYVKANAKLNDYATFDAEFFGFTPGEAAILDPQQRLLFETAWTSLEQAGYAPNSVGCPVGVFVGVGANTYLLQNLLPNKKLMQAKGAFKLNISSDKDFAATHLSYKLNLTGPAMSVQTACSTSLVAIHTACQNLLSFQCDMAIAGGASLSVPQESGYFFNEGGIASPDGHCRPFTAEANGTVRGSGAGIVTLKRLEDAIEDGDTIHSIILGSAINNDGSAKVGYTAPSIEGQSEVIAMAHSFAEIDAGTIGFIETHGTGTPLGDPVEFEALSRAFDVSNSPTNSKTCALGAVKGNIGHLDTAAGVASLIKATLSLRHRKIPPNVHASSTNPKIDFASSQFYLPEQLCDWAIAASPRRAGVSSFGIGGTNAHIVLQEAPEPTPQTTTRQAPQLIVLSARTAVALETIKSALATHLTDYPLLSVADLAHTLQVGRSPFEHRFAFVAETIAECIQKLGQASSSAQATADLEIVDLSKKSSDEQSRILQNIGTSWESGHSIDWTQLYPQRTARRIPLPAYPFAKTRHWIDPIEQPGPVVAKTAEAPLIPPAIKSPDSSIYQPVWKLAPLEPAATQNNPPTRCWLFINDTPEHLAIADAFKNAGYETQCIHPQPDYFSDAASIERLFQAEAAPEIEVILHLWNHTQVDDQAFDHLLLLAKALGKHRNQKPLKLLVACQSLFSIDGEAIENPKHALLTGPCLVVPQELPNIQATLLDTSELDAKTLQQEFATGFQSKQPLVIYRAAQRYARNFSSIPKPTASTSAINFTRDGTYWITGGLGGMGLAFAEQLLNQFQATVILTSRNAPSSEQLETLASLNENYNGRIQHFAADVTSLAAMQTVKDELIQKFGEIHGLIHTAGVPGGSILALKTVEEAAHVMAPKTHGLDVIETLFQDAPSTAIILCSSIAALQGGFGQADYCSANAYLDAWANAQRAKGRRNVVSINWDGWTESGMAVDSARGIQTKASLSKQKAAHPFFDSIEKTASHSTFTSHCSTKRHWMLSEHTVAGTSVLPGTAYLELARAAYAETHPAEACALSEVYFLTPFTLTGTETRTLEISLRPKADRIEFSVSSQASPQEDPVQHAKGILSKTQPKPPKTTALPELIKTFSGPQTPSSSSTASSERGPRWQSRQWIQEVPAAWLSYLELDTIYHADLADFPLHPALLDVAVGFPNHSDTFYLPFAYSKLHVFQPLQAKIYTWIRELKAPAPGMRSFDITLFDQSGSVLIEIENYQVRPFTQPAANNRPTTQRLSIATPGIFTSLQWINTPRTPPKAGSVEIEVHQTSLNFKDVLKALGTLSVPNAEALMGDECYGVVTQVSDTVSNLKPGDRVIALVSPSFQQHVNVHQDFVLAVPDAIDSTVAASFSIAAMTAYHALVNLGRLAPKESILIHAAAGGVGMAAVHLAKHLGATVYATAGSDEKRDYLRSLGVEHVYDSRRLDFAEQLMRDTDGQGVDVVLNSLAGEYIPRGLDVLKRYGRFLELGKRDILENNPLPLLPFDRSLSFIAANLDRDYPHFREIWNQAIEQLIDGTVPPLPTTVFAKENIAEAFQYMARAQHIGKVVVALKANVQADASSGIGLTDAQGQASLLLALRANAPQVIVSTIDLNQRIAKQRDAYKVLKAAVKASSPSPSANKAPRLNTPAEVQKAIKTIWHDVLGVESIKNEDNFFEIGGDSLAAVQVLSHLNGTFEKQIPITEFFSNPTIQALGTLFSPTPPTGNSNESSELEQSLDRARQRKARRSRRAN